MSHFTVAVITKDEDIASALAPFQENNMGDCPSEYMEFNDVEAEYRKEYEEDSAKEFYCESSSSHGYILSKENFEALKNSTNEFVMTVEKGGFCSYFKLGGKYRGGYYPTEEHRPAEENQWFIVDKINRTEHPDKDVCFEGEVVLKKIDPPKDVLHKDCYEDFDTFIKDWAGHTKDEDGRYGYYENPNAKWDWYAVGGRWSGELRDKQGREQDSLQMNQIDFISMQDEQKEKYTGYWLEAQEKIKAGDEHAGFMYNIKKGQTKEEYVGDGKFSTFAVIYHGKWFEKGERGWWACVSDEKEPEEWERVFNGILENTGADDYITIVDCHI